MDRRGSRRRSHARREGRHHDDGPGTDGDTELSYPAGVATLNGHDLSYVDTGEGSAILFTTACPARTPAVLRDLLERLGIDHGARCRARAAGDPVDVGATARRAGPVREGAGAVHPPLTTGHPLAYAVRGPRARA